MSALSAALRRSPDRCRQQPGAAAGARARPERAAVRQGLGQRVAPGADLDQPSRTVGRRPGRGAAKGDEELAGLEGLQGNRDAERGPDQRAAGRGGEEARIGRLVDAERQVDRPVGRRADAAGEVCCDPADQRRHRLRLRRRHRLVARHPLRRHHLLQLRRALWRPEASDARHLDGEPGRHVRDLREEGRPPDLPAGDLPHLRRGGRQRQPSPTPRRRPTACCTARWPTA